MFKSKKAEFMMYIMRNEKHSLEGFFLKKTTNKNQYKTKIYYITILLLYSSALERHEKFLDLNKCCLLSII